MTTDPFVTLVFFASVFLFFIGAAVIWDRLWDFLDRRRRLSRKQRRNINGYRA